jgi:hypothetical protein
MRLAPYGLPDPLSTRAFSQARTVRSLRLIGLARRVSAADSVRCSAEWPSAMLGIWLTITRAARAVWQARQQVPSQRLRAKSGYMFLAHGTKQPRRPPNFSGRTNFSPAAGHL